YLLTYAEIATQLQGQLVDNPELPIALSNVDVFYRDSVALFTFALDSDIFEGIIEFPVIDGQLTARLRRVYYVNSPADLFTDRVALSLVEQQIQTALRGIIEFKIASDDDLVGFFLAIVN